MGIDRAGVALDLFAIVFADRDGQPRKQRREGGVTPYDLAREDGQLIGGAVALGGATILGSEAHRESLTARGARGRWQ